MDMKNKSSDGKSNINQHEKIWSNRKAKMARIAQHNILINDKEKTEHKNNLKREVWGMNKGCVYQTPPIAVPFITQVCLVANQHDNDITSSLCSDIVYPLWGLLERVEIWGTEGEKSGKVSLKRKKNCVGNYWLINLYNPNLALVKSHLIHFKAKISQKKVCKQTVNMKIVKTEDG